MRMISLRRLLFKLAVLTLSVGPAAAGQSSPFRESLDEELVEDAPIDREHTDPDDAATTIGRSLARSLAAMRPLEATQLATTWATSSDPIRRAAIAYALGSASPLGADTILEHLSHDDDPLVVRAIARSHA